MYTNDEPLITNCFCFNTNRENYILSTGFLVVSNVEPTGLGGCTNVTFACNGCKLRTVNFCGSALVKGSKRTVVGLALAVAFL